MELQTTIYIIVGLTFALYVGIAIWARAGSTSEFYVAGSGVNPVVNGMATAADWMSAASFISMAGLIAYMGYGGSLFLMGWTGGYVLLACLLAPYLRKFGKFTVPQFIGDRYYSKSASTIAVICLLVASITYIIGQMTGVGIAFSRFLGVTNDTGIYIGMAIVFSYAVFGGMKGITYTQVAQYLVLITAFFISLSLTGNPIPQLGLGADNVTSGKSLLVTLNEVIQELGFNEYTTQLPGSKLNMFVYTLSLMIGTAGLPHVIIHDPVARQQTEHVCLHPVTDDRYCWLATRDHPLLHGQDRGRCPLIGWLVAGVHCVALHDCSGCRCHGSPEPAHHHEPDHHSGSSGYL